MATTTVKTAPKTIEELDISGLNAADLYNLSQKSLKCYQSKMAEEKEKGQLSVFDKKEIETFRSKIKDLEKEFKLLPSKFDSTVNVPIKFEMNFNKFNSLSEMMESMTINNWTEFHVEDIMEDHQFNGKIISKNSNLDKIQKPYLENAITDFTDGACIESLNMFPEERKKIRDFVKKVNTAIAAIKPKLSPGQSVKMSLLLKSEL